MTSVIVQENGQPKGRTFGDAKKARKWCRSVGLSVTNATFDKASDTYTFDDSVKTAVKATAPSVKRPKKNRKPHVQAFTYLSAPIPADPEAEGFRHIYVNHHTIARGDIITLSGHTFRVHGTLLTDNPQESKLIVEDTPLTFILRAGETFEVYRP